MVTSFERHDIPAQISNVPARFLGERRPSPGFPLSSPPAETLASFKPSNGAAVLPLNNLFLASNTFTSNLSDDDDGSSSGQDEFHLERYSQNTSWSQSMNPGQKRSLLPTSRVRKIAQRKSPGLNIVTNFPNEHRTPRSEGIVVDEVQSQKPQLGRRTAASVVSAKAEHVNQSMMDLAIQQAMAPTAGKPQSSEEVVNGAQKLPASQRRQGWEAVARLTKLQAARKAATISAKNNQALQPIQIPSSSRKQGNRNPNNVDGVSGHSRDARSIVIGLSVPSSEAEAHRSRGAVDSNVSAQTPQTPVIVITPAEETDSWKPPFLRKARPASSLYSAHPRDDQLARVESPPPVPKLPPSEPGYAPGARTTRPSAEPNHWDMDDPTFEDEKYSESCDSPERISSESQERILPSEEDKARHKSQGWWNLMLSPMLSRKGTITENDKIRIIETPPLPPMPDLGAWEKRKSISSVSAESPETPRRLGLASARASIWSRWTSWEKQRAVKSQERQLDDSTSDLGNGKALSPGAEEAQPIDLADNIGNGLATEYYHACAVELLSGVQYFECQNHSCVEKLPQFHSIFEPETVAERCAETGNLTRPAIGAIPNASVEGRSMSGVTSYPEAELSPMVREADTAAVLKATAVDTPKTGDGGSREVELESTDAENETIPIPGADLSPAPDTTQQLLQNRETSAVVPKRLVQPALLSPGPVSPAMQQTLTSQGAVPMAEIDRPHSHVRSMEQTEVGDENQTWSQTEPSSVTIHHHTTYAQRNPTATGPIYFETRRELMDSQPAMTSKTKGAVQVSASDTEPPNAHTADAAKKPGIISRLKSMWDKMKRKNNEEAKPKKRRWTLIIGIFLFLIVIGSILLATLLTRKGDGTPVQSQWLNLTGYPPIPTGISTIAMPDAVKEQPDCVAPTTMWSCALPKEDQAEIAPNNPDQPNFRFEITFENGTVPANMTIPVDNVSQKSSKLKARADDPFTEDLFTPNPAPPSRADQIFMGNTTDNITQPFQGEETPFFMTFIPVFPVDPSDITNSSASVSRLAVRQATNSSDDIPAPDVLSDGSAAPANLLPTSPYPTSQPIQLYNRGQADEHYGFYMYYDKAIFLKTTAPVNTSEFADNDGVVPDDENGGSTRDQAKLRCTFSQTRFLVRMWTNAAFGANLLSPISVTNKTKATNSSATDFNRPGSFPYPTTISLDRHGGNINKKAVYCYGVDDLQVIQDDVRSIVPELRGVDGQLINPAPALVNGSFNTANSGFDPAAGGIDGGTGGCECVWQNWN
ncbi:hypothetical protein EDD36DRAFT_275787 [Exophiala viscosa]|uniref:Glycoprotease family protein n=1 Tax=Exophiala viscosa TaxID=2486360 RepID=A0AAN6DT77_9EURO|nr:hypothetical protein EDD36DRAFT_275787 [Exophiala viscosa]